MGKQISKSTDHAKALIAGMGRIRAEYQKLVDASKADKSMGEKERVEDIALFQRKIADCDKMISWWKADIAAKEEKAKAASKADAKTTEKATA